MKTVSTLAGQHSINAFIAKRKRLAAMLCILVSEELADFEEGREGPRIFANDLLLSATLFQILGGVGHLFFPSQVRTLAEAAPSRIELHPDGMIFDYRCPSDRDGKPRLTLWFQLARSVSDCLYESGQISLGVYEVEDASFRLDTRCQIGLDWRPSQLFPEQRWIESETETLIGLKVASLAAHGYKIDPDPIAHLESGNARNGKHFLSASDAAVLMERLQDIQRSALCVRKSSV